MTDLVIYVSQLKRGRSFVNFAPIRDFARIVPHIGLVCDNADYQRLNYLEGTQRVSMRQLSAHHDVTAVEELRNISSVVLLDQEFASWMQFFISI